MKQQSRMFFFHRLAVLLLATVLLSLFSLTAFADPEDTSGDDLSSDETSALTSDLVPPVTGGETYAAPTLTSTDMVTPGGTLTLTVTACGEGIYGFEGEILYDPEMLTFAGSRSLLSSWSVYTADDRFLFCSDTMQSAFSSQSVADGDALAQKSIFTLIFRVSENAVPGQDCEIRLRGFTQTDGRTPILPGDPAFTRRIAPQSSDSARLTALSAGHYPMEPSFDSEIFSYEVKDVPANLDSIEFSYEKKSEDLTVTVSDGTLVGGRNLMTITVEAPDGSIAVYSVTVVRAFDDGYQPSSDGALTLLTPGRGALTPTFDPEKTDYLVTLPNEAMGELFTLSGEPRDPKVGKLSAETVVLAEGIQTVRMTVTAEDGSETVYTVHVLVMPKYEGDLPYVSSDRTLEGLVQIREVAEGYLATVATTRSDAVYGIAWYADGDLVGSGELLSRSESLEGKELKAVAVGEQGFVGTLSVTMYLDSEGSLQLTAATGPKVTLFPHLLILLTLLFAAALIFGFLVGRVASRRRETAELTEDGPEEEDIEDED